MISIVYSITDRKGSVMLFTPSSNDRFITRVGFPGISSDAMGNAKRGNILVVTMSFLSILVGRAPVCDMSMKVEARH
jgi:hypothetical protein